MDLRKILLIVPYNKEFQDIYYTINREVTDETSTIISVGSDRAENDFRLYFEKEFKSADIVIADITGSYPNVIYALGVASAMSKPIITICQKGEQIPFDLNRFLVLLYDRKFLRSTLILPLLHFIKTQEYSQFLNSKDIKNEIRTVFISYSHVDKEFLNRLLIHLRPFEKKGLIDLWVDTKIKIGEKWKEKINQALEKSAIAILLVSADFLASDFIVDNELPPLLSAAEEQGKLILPVILKPCSFIRDHNLSKFQAVNDPNKPLSSLNENDREVVFAKIADYIDSLVIKK